MADYSFWINALKDPSKIGTDLPVHENDPQPGFYRMRNRDGGDMVPVAIWKNGSGEIVAKVGNRMIDNPTDVWSFCCRFPVLEGVYRGFVNGGSWPDTPPENEAIAKAGHNLPEDPFEAIKLELQGEIEIAEDLLKKPVKDQDAADMVANFASRVAAIKKKADELHSVEKRPILDAAKETDDKWRWVRDKSKVVAEQLKRHLDSFLAEQRRLEAERQRKAREDAEAKRRAAEEALKKARDVSANPNDPEDEAKRLEAERLADEARRAEAEAKAKAVKAGRTGSTVSMRTFKSAEITDYDKLLEALKGRDEMKELVQSLANRAAKADIELPGMKIVKEERAV